MLRHRPPRAGPGHLDRHPGKTTKCGHMGIAHYAAGGDAESHISDGALGTNATTVKPSCVRFIFSRLT